jgi:hypothetical protein
MGDDLAHVKPAFQQRDHLVPGLEHLAPIDALDGERGGGDAEGVDEIVASGGDLLPVRPQPAAS